MAADASNEDLVAEVTARLTAAAEAKAALEAAQTERDEAKSALEAAQTERDEAKAAADAAAAEKVRLVLFDFEQCGYYAAASFSLPGAKRSLD